MIFMKRILVSLLSALLLSLACNAQSLAVHYGAHVGITADKLASFGKDFKNSGCTGWHAGFTAILKLPAHFAIQPSVNFEQSSGRMPVTGSKLWTEAINVPVSLQWGPDLGIVRLYAQAVPYVDFILNSHADSKWDKELHGDAKHFYNPVQFGLGVGGGLDVWRLQLSCRYNFGLTRVGKDVNMKNEVTRRGVTFTVAYMFK